MPRTRSSCSGNAPASRAFRQVAERVPGVMVTQLGDPDAGTVADAIRHYRQFTGDAHLATRALDLGHATFALAMQHLPDGRDHGCSARSVSAAGRGHGRENNAGVVTALLTPLAALPW